MSDNIVNTTVIHQEKTPIINLYKRFQGFLKCGSLYSNNNNQIKKEMSTPGNTTLSDETFITPASSSDDLIAMSPKRNSNISDHSDIIDHLTGSEFDSICDITMREATSCDMLIDSTSLDYLVKCSESNRCNSLIDRGKESLFVKFDPLYANRNLVKIDSIHSESAVSAECDIGYETGSAASGAENSYTIDKEPLSLTSMAMVQSKEKPMQVVPPVVNVEVSKSHAIQTQSTPVLVRSLSAILPNHVATDRLISFSGDTPPIAAPRSPNYTRSNSPYILDRVRSLQLILQKQDQEVQQLRQENRSLSASLRDMELSLSQHTRLKEDLDIKFKKIIDERNSLLEDKDKLMQQINERILSNKQMSIVMEEYEKTISSLIGEQQREKVQFQVMQEKLVTERDQALNHLSNMESSFNDLLAKYEKCKSVVLESKDRESLFRQNIAENEEAVKKYEALYNELKRVTSETLSHANETLDSVEKKHEVEIKKMSAKIKKLEIQCSSLQESLAQRTRDNEELTKICDQLLSEGR